MLTGAPRTEEELDELLSCPSPAAVAALASVAGDLVVVGAGGKMGPSLARMARRALDAAGSARQVTAVSRFSEPTARAGLERHGVRTIRADLLDRREVDRLPDAGAIVFMAGMKFGASRDAARTWATNCYAAALVAERYAGVPTVAFSTGNVYPLVPIDGGGAREDTPPAPIGDYAQSALGRERIFEFFARERGTPVLLLRLNYAVELRYGVLRDVADKVAEGRPVDLTMGHVNCIWQGDANALALASLALVRRPARVLNLTGLATIRVRDVAERIGAILGKAPLFAGAEAATALLSDASLAATLLGPPATDLEQVIAAVAAWVSRRGRSLAKPTHFENRDGSF